MGWLIGCECVGGEHWQWCGIGVLWRLGRRCYRCCGLVVWCCQWWPRRQRDGRVLGLLEDEVVGWVREVAHRQRVPGVEQRRRQPLAVGRRRERVAQRKGAAERCAALGGGVRGHGLAAAEARRGDPLRQDSAGGEVGGDAVGALFGQRLVDRVAPGAVGVAHDFHQGLLVLVDHGSDRVEHGVELGADRRRIGLEGDVAGHVEDDLVADAAHGHAGAGQPLAQGGLQRVRHGDDVPLRLRDVIPLAFPVGVVVVRIIDGRPRT